MKIKIDEKLIKKFDVVAVAFSGGEDSTALLFELLSLSKRKGFLIKTIHINHSIRKEESIEDALFCKSLSEKLGIDFSCVTVDAPAFSKLNGYSLEEGARNLRYNAFLNAIDDGFCNKVALAHHRDDNIETIMLNLLRGSGLTGICGMDESIYDGKIIRPMLDTSKKDISSYIAYHNIPYRTDSTNADNRFLRNFLRLNVLPQIKARLPFADDSILRFSRNARVDDEFLYTLAKKKLTVCNNKAVVIACEKPIFVRATILALRHLGVEHNYTHKHLDAAYLLNNSISGSQINLLDDIVAVKEYNKVVLFRNDKKKTFNHPFREGEFKTESVSLKIDKVKNFKYGDLKNCAPGVLYIDSCAVNENAVIRNPHEGDIIAKFGGGTKSLKKYLIDKKISKNNRQNLLVIANANTIIAVCGVDISSIARIREETTVVYRIAAQFI